MRGMMKMLLKNNSEKVKILVRYFETLSIENKLKLFIIVLESDMIKLKIDKKNLIELLKIFLCVPSNSPIFLHCSNNTATHGCVAINRIDMSTLVNNIDADTKIEIKTK